MDLNQLQQILSTNAAEAAAIKSDLDKAKEFQQKSQQLLSSCDERLQKLVGAPQPKKQKSLKDVIRDVLNSSNEPLTVKEICELVLESGYKTVSKNFSNVVYQAIVQAAEFKRKTRPKTKPARYALDE